ncbi:hypothetical protein [Urechidicola croceus]|uniref:Uncharacterized protein n=1 Tax=Urechidicola croceus TaxID=1850246 RepID=A0A1D8P637_9FLAO|nr:hypothetical protein [Urechidicola croceus]AOW20034.1 hypothetical protein LPB138_04755 [Urechidicola croceus]
MNAKSYKIFIFACQIIFVVNLLFAFITKKKNNTIELKETQEVLNSNTAVDNEILEDEELYSDFSLAD